MELEDESRLVTRLLSGDVAALDQFVMVYRRFITAVLCRHAQLDPEDVDELYQRFLLHIWEDGYRRLRPWSGTRSLRAYLGAVARNLARDYRRERRSANENGERPQALMQTMDDAAARSDRRRIVRTALSQMSGRDQELIHRRYYLEESYREIAESLGMTVNHVGVALLRAESRLGALLEKHRSEL
jgi:RNA polymerase sigma factor (sigma-70 family)